MVAKLGPSAIYGGGWIEFSERWKGGKGVREAEERASESGDLKTREKTADLRSVHPGGVVQIEE